MTGLGLGLGISTGSNTPGVTTPDSQIGINALLITQDGKFLFTQDDKSIVAQELTMKLITQSGDFITTQNDRQFITS